MPKKTKVTAAQAAFLKNSEALNPIFGDAQAACKSILDIKAGIAKQDAKLTDVSTTLFMQVRGISKNEGLPAKEIFNRLAYLMGYDHKTDAAGNPDVDGTKKVKAGGRWPVGTLSTYRAVIQSWEKEFKQPIHKAPDMKAVRDDLKKEPKENTLIDEVKALQADKTFNANELAKIEKAITKLIGECRATKLAVPVAPVKVAAPAKPAEKKAAPAKPAKVAAPANPRAKGGKGKSATAGMMSLSNLFGSEEKPHASGL